MKPLFLPLSGVQVGDFVTFFRPYFSSKAMLESVTRGEKRRFLTLIEVGIHLNGVQSRMCPTSFPGYPFPLREEERSWDEFGMYLHCSDLINATTQTSFQGKGQNSNGLAKDIVSTLSLKVLSQRGTLSNLTFLKQDLLSGMIGIRSILQITQRNFFLWSSSKSLVMNSNTICRGLRGNSLVLKSSLQRWNTTNLWSAQVNIWYVLEGGQNIVS